MQYLKYNNEDIAIRSDHHLIDASKNFKFQTTHLKEKREHTSRKEKKNLGSVQHIFLSLLSKYEFMQYMKEKLNSSAL